MSSSKYDGSDYKEHPNANLAFTRAVLAFQSTKKKDVPKVEVAEVADPEALALKAHEERHKKRIRIARGVQHLLTGILSFAVAFLQGAVYVKYLQTKDVKGAWPTTPNLLPTLMLFGTAIAGIVFDSAALVAYAWPQTSLGKKALAVSAFAHKDFANCVACPSCQHNDHHNQNNSIRFLSCRLSCRFQHWKCDWSE